MAKYVPSGKIGGAGLAVLLLFAVAGAAVLGAGVHFVGRAIYFILIFPLLWGFVLGYVLSSGVRIGKCRNVSLAVILSVLSSAASYGIFHVLENAKVRSDIAGALRDESGRPVPQAGAVVDAFLRERYGQSGFWGLLRFRAEAGMNLSRRGRGGDTGKPMIHGTGMYVYWLVELAAIAGCCVLLPMGAARAAFCEACLEWYVKKDVAGVAAGKEDEARRSLAGKDFAAFGTCVGAGSAVLALEKCPKCSGSEVRALLETVSVDKKGNRTRVKVVDELLSREEANALVAALPRPEPPAISH
jgi:hypothetical protein